MSNGNICPKCNGRLTYIHQHDRWYCFTCNEYAPKIPVNDTGSEFIPVATTHQDTMYISPPQRKIDVGKVVLICTSIILAIALLTLAILPGIGGIYDPTQSDEYVQLEASYNNLSADYNQLNSQHSSLQTDYSTLNGQYSNLQTDYNILSSKYGLEEAMRVGHLLDDYYGVFRENYEPTGWWVFQPGTQEYADFAADIASTSLGRWYYTAIENEFYQNSYTAYGKYIHSGDRSYEKLVSVMNLIGIRASDNEVTKIDKILDFINDNLHYESDMDNDFLAPMETLGLKSGDCEDYAVLAGALFELAGIQSAIALGDDHAMVLVRMDNLGTHGYSYFDDLTSYDLSSGRWILIEPQARIEQQLDALGDFNLNVASEILDSPH